MHMRTVHVEVVTPGKKIYDGDARIIIARGIEGELGIQAGHTPLVTPLEIGIVSIQEANEEHRLAVSGGFLEVRPEQITILADTAERAEDIDVERAQAAKTKAEEKLSQLTKDDADYEMYTQAVQRAESRLELARKD